MESFEFVAGRIALDFVATMSDRDAGPVERLGGPSDLAEWIALAGVVDTRPRVSVEAFDRAVLVREAMYRVTSGALRGGSIRAADRRLVNATAAAAPPVPVLSATGAIQHRGDLDAVLSLLARDLLELLTREERDRVRWCDDAHCSRPFLDRSRGARRRWCGMSGCGDRAKAAAYRRRRRVSPS